MRHVLFLCAALAIMMGCSENRTLSGRLIRLADPERIDLPETPAAKDENNQVLGDWDYQSDWRHFSKAVELGGSLPKDGKKPEKPVIDPENKRLLIPQDIGIFQIIPAPPSSELLVQCKIHEQKDQSLVVNVFKLSHYQPLPEKYSPGLLREQVACFQQDFTQLSTEKKDGLLKNYIRTNQETRAIVLSVLHNEQGEGALEWAKITCLKSLEGVQRGGAHSHILPFGISKVIKPSIVLSVENMLAFKEVELPPDPVFQCSLAQMPGQFSGLKVGLRAKTRDQGVIEIFTHVFSPEEKGWIDLEKDLTYLNGERACFELFCDWADPENREAASPQVFVGAPILHSKKTPNDRKQMNLILISLDTLRYDRLGCYGFEQPVSPNIDEMAKQGILFRNAYSHAPYTLPAHASLFSSLYPSIHGAEHKQVGMLPKKIKLMAEILAENGWFTASFNGGGYVSHEFGFHRGFDVCCEREPLKDRFMNSAPGSLGQAFAWVENKREQPFFLFLHTFMVHDFRPPMEIAVKYNQGLGSAIEPSSDVVGGIMRKYNRGEEVTQEEVAYLDNMYNGTIEVADQMVGELVSFLKEKGLWENTVIILTSDHGEEFRDHDELFHSKTVYEEMIRIPLVMHVPGYAGREIKDYVSHVDVLPFVLDLFKINPDKIPMQGVSLKPLLEGKQGKNRVIYAETNQPLSTRRSCIIKNGLKCIEGEVSENIRWPAPARREFFDLNKDPYEKNRLTRNGKELFKLLDSFRQGLKKLKKEMDLGGGKPTSLSPELKELLKQQGYF